MLEKENLRIVACIEVDGENIFKYFFLAFRALIRGFNYIRKVTGIDETFSKGPYKGVLLVAMSQEDNSKCYPIA